MAKQRRPQQHKSTRSPAPAVEKPPRAAGAPGQPSRSQSGSGGPASGPPRRTTYVEAVAIYERGLEALQRHEYRSASDVLESVLRLYPEEKELHERVRLYLNVCARQLQARESAPQTVEERLYASTLAINGGHYDRAIAHLRLVRDEDPDNDHALYMLAVAHAQRGELAEAVAHLERAIMLNPENRGLARTDPDLEPLRGDDAFRAGIDGTGAATGTSGGAPLARADRRRPIRARSAR